MTMQQINVSRYRESECGMCGDSLYYICNVFLNVYMELILFLTFKKNLFYIRVELINNVVSFK